MRHHLSINSSKCCCLSVIFFLIRGIFGASFVSQPITMSASVGDDMNFNCIVANVSYDVHVEWWYVNQNLQLSVDNVLLTDDTEHFSIFNSLTPNGEFETELQLADVQLLDNGYYKCQIVSSSSMLLQINTLVVSDGDTIPVTGTSGSFDHPHRRNFTDCCLKEGVDSECLSVCAPESSELSANAFANCTSYSLEFIKCGSSERNHAPCCVKSQVPDFCLDICLNQLPILSRSQLSACAAYVQNFSRCFQEGFYLISSPPRLVAAELDSDNTGVRLSWQLPSQPGKERLSFRVFYRETAAPVYRSMPLTENLTEIVGDLHSNTHYRFFVISVNRWGSSLPSNFVEIATHQGVGVTSSPTDFSLLACCEEQRVIPMCRSYLCTGELISMEPGTDLLPCYSEIDKVFQCISGMRNNTECCIRHGLSPRCFPLCDGQLSQVTFEKLDCFKEMGTINSCFQEGHESIPGHPASIVLDSVSSTSAVLRWSLPNIGSDRVLHYTVRYREYNDPLFTAISVSGLNLTLVNLSPLTLHEVAVSSVGKLGTSLPSPVIVFQTYWLPDEHETGFQPTSSSLRLPFSEALSPAESLARCCLEANISRDCLKFCSYSLSPSNSSASGFLPPCLSHINRFLYCATDGMNHKDCCQRKGIKTSCLGYCSGTISSAPYDIDCLLDMPTMLTCFLEDSRVLPSMPLKVAVLNKTAYTIVLGWLPPLRNSGLVDSYVVSYCQDKMTATWSKGTTNDLSFILQNLLPDTTYFITVAAQGKQGTSLPTQELEARTLPVNVVKNVNIERNLTDCCELLNVGKSCLPVCGGSGTVGINECGRDLGKIIKCAAAGQDHSSCCRRRNIPTHCLDFCRGSPKVDSFPGLICVSFIEHVFSCFNEGFENLPDPPDHFSFTEVGSTYIVFTWSESGFVVYNFYYTSRSTNETFSVEGVHSPYLLPNLRPYSQYDVYMVAVNAYGASSPAVTLTVTTTADSSNRLRVEQEPEGYVAVGSKVVLRCFGPEDTSPVWLHHNGRRSALSVLQIDAATERDGGRYTCVVQGSDPESADIILKVQYAPFVEPRFQSFEVDSGNDHVVHLECNFFGFPDTVLWQHVNGTVVQTNHANDHRYTAATYVVEDTGVIVAQLSINQVSEDDFGWYICEGSNFYASGKGYVILRAPGATLVPALPPSSLPRTENVAACCLEKRISSGCASACVFDVDITAIRLKRLQCIPELPKMVECSADGRNHSRCCIDRRVPSRCLSFCSGFVSTPVDMTCLVHISEIIDCMENGHANLPSRPLNVTITINAVVLVSWLPPASNPNLVQFYEVSYSTGLSQGIISSQNTASSEVHFMVLKDIMSFTHYDVTVIAHNHHGSSIPSDRVSFTTHEPFPPPPSNVTALAIDSTSIQVMWGHPKVDRQFITFYCIYFQAEDKGNLTKVMVGRSVFDLTLKGLQFRTVYRIYVTAVTSHFESSPSLEITIQTADSDFWSQSQASLGAGLFFVFFVSFLVAVAVSCWCRRHLSRLRESVFFENPSYTCLGGGQIRLPVSEEGDGDMHSSDYKTGSGSNDGSTMAAYVECIILEDADDRQRNVAYASLPTADYGNLRAVGCQPTNGDTAGSS